MNESSASITNIFAGTSLRNIADSSCLDSIVDSGATNHMGWD